jgi:intracellular sulfur oxidation DsrE/DsrF family protein
MFRGVLAGAGAVFGAAQARAATSDSGRQKVVYHLADLDKVTFVLGNIRNHYDGTGGRVDIALVVHGPALSAFRTAGASAPLSSRFAGLLKRKLTPYACANTMHGMDIALTDLFKGFLSAEAGGVVKIAELQGQGYAYIRP